MFFILFLISAVVGELTLTSVQDLVPVKGIKILKKGEKHSFQCRSEGSDELFVYSNVNVTKIWDSEIRNESNVSVFYRIVRVSIPDSNLAAFHVSGGRIECKCRNVSLAIQILVEFEPFIDPLVSFTQKFDDYAIVECPIRSPSFSYDIQWFDNENILNNSFCTNSRHYYSMSDAKNGSQISCRILKENKIVMSCDILILLRNEDDDLFNICCICGIVVGVVFNITIAPLAFRKLRNITQHEQPADNSSA